ncbi:MAG: DnaJ domain-containing protein [Alphaproteobacteria bacterium]
MQILLLGLVSALGLVLAVRWLAGAEPASVARALRVFAVAAAVLLLAFVVLSGRWGLIPLFLFIGLPWLNRLRAIKRAARTRQGPTQGKTSEVETRFLRLTLDHDTGALDGEVRAGSFAGRPLADLALDELHALLVEVAGDDESVRLIEAYLDREHVGWREGAPANLDGDMGRKEAYRVLGLAPGASEAEIREAHRKLMTRMHPDRGGSDYLAAKINRAKDVLLGG